MAAQQLQVTVPPELVTAGAAAGGVDGKAAASLAAGQRTLPRASVVIHGGDLCYPSPTGEWVARAMWICGWGSWQQVRSIPNVDLWVGFLAASVFNPQLS